MTPSAPFDDRPLRGGSYEAVIKINRDDPGDRRAADIEQGIGYACALLLDEYGRSADEIARLLERVTDDVQDEDANRG